MNRKKILLSALIGLGCTGVTHGALLYSPVVLTVGNGATLSSAGTSSEIRVYAPSIVNQAAPVASAAFNSGISGTRLVNSGTATSEGNLSNNPRVILAAAAGVAYPTNVPQYVFNAGYNAAEGTASITGATANAPRSFGRTEVSNYAVGTPTVLQTQTQASAYSANNIRSATADEAGTLFTGGTGGGSTGGWRNFGTNTILSAAPTNVRAVEFMGSELFGTTGSGTTGLYRVSPTGSFAATAFIATAGSPYEFLLVDDPGLIGPLNLGFDTAYIADDRSAASGGGIQKWTWNGISWTLAYTLRDSGYTAGLYRGLAGQYDTDTGRFTLYTTASESTPVTSRLQQVTDTGAGSSFSTLATISIADGYVFRGVALAAIPEPSNLVAGSLALLGMTTLGLRRRRAK